MYRTKFCSQHQLQNPTSDILQAQKLERKKRMGQEGYFYTTGLSANILFRSPLKLLWTK